MTDGEFIDWLTFKDPASAVTTDVRRIRNHPLVPGRIPIYGFVYDVRTGKLIEVPEATEIGAATASQARQRSTVPTVHSL